MAAEIVGSPVISALINNLIPIASEEIYHVWGVKNEITKLRQTLLGIQAVLTDAEKQLEQDTVMVWLQNLKEVVYQSDDILDEIAYETLRRKMEVQGRVQRKVNNFFSLSNPVLFRLKMSHKIKHLNQILDHVAREKDQLGLCVRTSCSGTAATSTSSGLRHRGTFSHVDSSEIVGRELAKSNIIKLLVNSSDNGVVYSVVRIVGMGGVGKTALAKLVYGDQSVTDHFNKNKLWVSVAKNSDQKEVLINMLELIMEKKCGISSLDLIVSKLKESVQGKRYLIVLDDVWNDENNKWDDMLTTLLHICSHRSKVIVTTRSEEVGSRLRSSYEHRLEGLRAEDWWSLFKINAFLFGGVEKTSDLIRIGKNIAKKCGGVPLAAKVIGCLMSRTDEVEWQSVADSDVWDLQEGEEKVVRVLKLSYDYLNPHLKQCFSYCSLFPKGHVMKKKKLIQLWMAEGFLGSSKSNKDMEEVGNEYYNFLFENTFFQEGRKNEYGDMKACKMHGIVHDLALSVAGTEYWSMLDVDENHEMGTKRLRHVCFALGNEFSTIPEAMYEETNLRTFIASTPKFINDAYAAQIFSKFRCLRVLDLSDSAIVDLPSSISKLKHLRYLDLSNSQVTTLPDSLTRLYNLQTLILKNCFQLKGLPRKMKKLINLRHLIICKTRRNEWIPPMPSKVRNLRFLHYLPIFVVGNKKKGFGIEELRNLNLLGGKLQIHNLDNVRDNEAEAGCLKEKQHILRLELHWPEIDNSSGIVSDGFAVLEGLQPHQNLKRLGIYNYVGSKFSTWMMSPNSLLLNLVFVVLKNCYLCEKLPPLGLLPCLKILKLEGLYSVQSIGSEFYGGNDVSSFPLLEELSLVDMLNLVVWSDQVSSSTSSFSSFPRLEQLKVKYCHKLTIMPTRFPSLKVLEFEDCNGKPVSSLVENNLSSLTSIQIKLCEELVFLPRRLLIGNDILHSLVIWNCQSFEGFNPDQDLEEEEEYVELLPNSALYTLCLFDCPALTSWPDLHGFNSLSFLLVIGCKRQKYISSGIECLPKLEYLGIGGFSEELDSFPFPAANIDEDGNAVGNYFPSLSLLYIYGWYKLKCLPHQIQYLTSLQTLHMWNFHSLVVLPEWLGNLASLRDLEINSCQDLKCLPSQEQMLRLTSLQQLKLIDCRLLVNRCKGGGQESDKIRHIPKVEFHLSE